MYRKTIAIILGAVMLFALAACSATSEKPAERETEITAAPEETPAAPEKTDEALESAEQAEEVKSEEPKQQTRAEKLLAEGEAGNGRSYTDLGRMYEKGNGVEQDYEKALEYYRLSAEAEKPDFKGMRYAGLMYRDGSGVAQDYVKAAECFEKAAETGDVSAAYFLGLLYEEGNGVQKSDAEAKMWYEKAVSTVDEFISNTRNNGPDELKLALCRLAEMALGEENTEKAIEYYQYAARLGWSQAKDKLTELGVSVEGEQ